MRLAIAAILLAFPISGSFAQNRADFVVDGELDDWMWPTIGWDPIYDVVPDTSSSVDLMGWSYGFDHFGSNQDNTRRELFTFLLQFLAPTFEGSDPTTVELIFDTSPDTTFGDSTPPWRNFLADYRVGVTGSNGRITNRFYKRYVGGQWNTVEGSSISQLEVEIAEEGQWIEGAIPWEYLGITDRYGSGGSRLHWTFLVSKGEYRDYSPDEKAYGYGPWLPYSHRFSTEVEDSSWGGIKDLE